MSAWFIILIGLWIYPIVSWLLLRLSKNKPRVRKAISYTLITVTALALFGLITDISFTLSELDWILVSSIYLSISYLLWWTQFQKNKELQVFGVISMVCIFGFGYLSGTIGILGVGFVVAEFETDTERWLGDGLIYKETPLGNALADYRGKRVEIYQTISWFPVIELRKQKKEYYSYIPYSNVLNVDYRPLESKMILSASGALGNEAEHWADTLILQK